MSHAEALQTLHPAAGATEAIVHFVSALRYAALSDEVRHYARRHLLDTIGVMIAGAGGEVATRAEVALAAVRPAGRTAASTASARLATSPPAPAIMTPTVSSRCRRV